MSLLIQKLINSIVQIIIFSAIPFVWWLVTSRNKCPFLEWIGLKKISNAGSRKVYYLIIGISLAFLLVSVFILNSLKEADMAISEFSELGINAFPAILIYAVFNTSLPEEIFFRGFLLKRLADKFGYNVGNITQAVIFGLLHGVMFFSSAGVLKAILIIVFTGAVGWCIGYVNEKEASGSILPGWFIHALANIFSGLYSAFF
ncbi:MAG: CPBP family intramembrane glutamic endopeptidase [Erysipelotrichaceae bacterium]|jgi:membrane protease YdiL (CAAX protease family)